MIDLSGEIRLIVLIAHIINIVIPTEGFPGFPERPLLAFWGGSPSGGTLCFQRHYYVYMMISSSRRALYTGVTGHLRQRVWEHKTGALDGFSKQYHTTRLVYFEPYRYVRSAIGHEKRIKRWRRDKKIALIEAMNLSYRDLAAHWFEPQGPSTRAKALGRDDNR